MVSISITMATSWLGLLLLYLSSQHQLLLKPVINPIALRTISLALLINSLVLLLNQMQAITAVFIIFFWSMMWLTLLPYLAVLKLWLCKQSNG